MNNISWTCSMISDQCSEFCYIECHISATALENYNAPRSGCLWNCLTSRGNLWKPRTTRTTNMGDGFMDQKPQQNLNTLIWHFTNIKSLPGTILYHTVPAVSWSPKLRLQMLRQGICHAVFSLFDLVVWSKNYGSSPILTKKQIVFDQKKQQFFFNLFEFFNQQQPSSTHQPTTTLGNHQFSVVGSCLLSTSNGIQGLPPGNPGLETPWKFP